MTYIVRFWSTVAVLAFFAFEGCPMADHIEHGTVRQVQR